MLPSQPRVCLVWRRSGSSGDLSWECLTLRRSRAGFFEGNPVGEGTTRRGTATVVHRPETPAGSTHSSTRGLRAPEQLERPAARMEDWTSLGQHKRKPEFPFVTRESHRNSRKTPGRRREKPPQHIPCTQIQWRKSWPERWTRVPEES